MSFPLRSDFGERTVAGDHRRPNCFGEGHLHFVVGTDVIPPLPRTGLLAAVSLDRRAVVGRGAGDLVAGFGFSLLSEGAVADGQSLTRVGMLEDSGVS
jgi:hypothetical protein